MPTCETPRRKALRLTGGHTSAPVLKLRTQGEGRTEWKCRGRTMTYGGNRESDDCHKPKELSFAWPDSFTRVVFHEILQKHTALHNSSDSRESEVEGGRGVNRRLGTPGQWVSQQEVDGSHCCPGASGRTHSLRTHLGRVRKAVEGSFCYRAFELDFSWPLPPTHLL